MCNCSEQGALSFEALLTDPMTRMVMDSDGVSVDDLIAVLEAARVAMERHELLAGAAWRN